MPLGRGDPAVVLVVIGVLFLIIEVVALVMGLALARSITSSVHELFTGTERVRQGDFTHRIDIADAAISSASWPSRSTQMTGSIEDLLQTAAEKKRLEEELRIAREIQMSLLPQRAARRCRACRSRRSASRRAKSAATTTTSSRSTTDRLGVLIADVSGKGTSAALYMAELKGLMLSLSQIYTSPRELLIEANRIISRAPRQPQLHHDDLRGHRSATRGR